MLLGYLVVSLFVCVCVMLLDDSLDAPWLPGWQVRSTGKSAVCDHTL